MTDWNRDGRRTPITILGYYVYFSTCHEMSDEIFTLPNNSTDRTPVSICHTHFSPTKLIPHPLSKVRRPIFEDDLSRGDVPKDVDVPPYTGSSRVTTGCTPVRYEGRKTGNLSVERFTPERGRAKSRSSSMGLGRQRSETQGK